MKKVIILIAIVGVVVGLWYWGSTRASLLEEAGKLATASWGQVEVPISASGEARERQRVEIKAEASGTITKILVNEGDRVKPDQLLLQIDKDEEEKNVEKAASAVRQTEESLEIAKLSHEQAKQDETFNVELVRTACDLARARFDFAESEYNRFLKLDQDDQSSNTELMRKKTEFLTAKAELARAEVDLKRAADAGPRNVLRTAHEIDLAKARLSNAKSTHEDAERRLDKTDVRNNYPSACRVVRIFVSQGQVVSSAISVVGAGTPVMELADIDKMEVEAQVDESDVDQVVRMKAEGEKQRQAGNPTTAPDDQDAPHYRDEVKVRFDALPRQLFRGRIMDIAQKPRTMAQIITYDVRIRLNDDPRIDSVRLGMQGTVEFAPVSEEGLCVDYTAVHKVSRDQYVVKMPDPDDPRAEPIDREVEVGLTDGRNVIIRSGLDEGEQVYVKLPTRIRKGD